MAKQDKAPERKPEISVRKARRTIVRDLEARKDAKGGGFGVIVVGGQDPDAVSTQKPMIR